MPASPQPDFCNELRDLIDYDSNTGAMNYKTGPRAGEYVGWIDNGYIRFEYNRRKLCAREVAWFLQFGTWPHLPVHSNNDNPADLRIRNLRLGTGNEANTGHSRRMAQIFKITDPAEHERQRAAFSASYRTKPAHPLATPKPANDPAPEEQLW